MTHLKGKARAAYVRTMFGRIAPRYDFMNMLMTAGRDSAWRRWAIHEAALPPGGRLLDVATGTGDMALEAVRQVNGACVVGADFTPEMMRLGLTKPNAASVRWTGADALRLPFPDDAFDAVTSGFMMRNVIDIAGALAEQRRVTRPGGRVVCLKNWQGLHCFRLATCTRSAPAHRPAVRQANWQGTTCRRRPSQVTCGNTALSRSFHLWRRSSQSENGLYDRLLHLTEAVYDTDRQFGYAYDVAGYRPRCLGIILTTPTSGSRVPLLRQ